MYNVDVDLNCEEEDGAVEGRGVYKQVYYNKEYSEEGGYTPT